MVEFFKNGTPVPEESLESRRARERRERQDRRAAEAARPKKRIRRCAVCLHPERQRIEALHVAGVSLDRLAEKFNVHRDAIWRHMQRHVSEETKTSYLIGSAKIAELAEIASEESSSVLDHLRVLRSVLFSQIDRVASEKDHMAVAALSQRAIHVLREIGKVTGEISTLASSTVVNITNTSMIMSSPPFVDLQSGLLRIVAEHPDARPAIIGLLHELDGRRSVDSLSRAG